MAACSSTKEQSQVVVPGSCHGWSPEDGAHNTTSTVSENGVKLDPDALSTLAASVLSQVF